MLGSLQMGARAPPTLRSPAGREPGCALRREFTVSVLFFFFSALKRIKSKQQICSAKRNSGEAESERYRFELKPFTFAFDSVTVGKFKPA